VSEPADDGPTVEERRSLVDGVTNFRDLGGYRTADGREVRRGLVFRSGSLHALTEADLDRLRALDLRTAFDLRSMLEQEAEPLAAPFVRHVSVPLERRSGGPVTDFEDGAAYLRSRYRELLVDLAPEIGSVLRALAHDDCLPGVLHCAAGKDRTGATAAVLLLALGVDEESVLDDYELTSAYESAERVRELAAKLASLPPALAAGLLGTDRSALAGGLEEVRARFGSIETYLEEGCGLAPDTLDALRARLTA
jgi:protein-tyrosine phosphatase